MQKCWWGWDRSKGRWVEEMSVGREMLVRIYLIIRYLFTHRVCVDQTYKITKLLLGQLEH